MMLLCCMSLLGLAAMLISCYMMVNKCISVVYVSYGFVLGLTTMLGIACLALFEWHVAGLQGMAC